LWLADYRRYIASKASGPRHHAWSELRRVLAATYHQVWWPDTPVKYRDGDELPVWHDQLGGYRPGVLTGSPQAARCIGYLTKHVSACHQATTGPEHDHAARLAEALRYQPCSPRR
jgi:hypothetical protein